MLQLSLSSESSEDATDELIDLTTSTTETSNTMPLGASVVKFNDERYICCFGVKNNYSC